MDQWSYCIALSLDWMKAAAYILLGIWSFLLLEPLSANFNFVSNYSSCTGKQETKSFCCKSKCEKPAQKKENKDCEKKGCNPIMSCPTGNFYLSGLSGISVTVYVTIKEKKVLMNDNRIVKQNDDCWHPPEII